MISSKRRLCFCLILITAIVALSTTSLSAQAQETKNKPSGSISGRVTVGEKPAPGIVVVVNGMTSTIVTQARTDTAGNYRIGGLAAGQFNVSPVAPVYVVPAGTRFGQGRVLNLSANEEVEGIDFKLTRGGVITGRLTDADGGPVIEERISLLFVDENGAPARVPVWRSSNSGMYQTDDRGVFRLYGLPAGHYKVGAGDDQNRNGGIRATGSYPKVFYPDAAEISKAAIVDVSEGGETRNIDIKLGRRSSTYSVSGRVVNADSGSPLAGAHVSIGILQQSGNQSFVNTPAGPTTSSNSQGEFRIEGLLPGRYALMLIHDEFGRSISAAPKVFSEPVSFEILEGDVSNIEIKAQRGLSISGVVVPEGITDKTVLARLSKLLVSVSVNRGPSEIRVSASASYSAVNPDGSFLIEGLSAGKVTLGVGYTGSDLLGFTKTRIEYNGTAQVGAIDLPPGQDISGVKIYVSHGTGVVRGQVRVEGGTLPTDAIIRVLVNREDGAPQTNGQVDSRGRFIIRGITPGTYEVVLQIISLGAQFPPRAPARLQPQTVTVADGTETEVFFTLDLSRKDGP